ncbi:MAG TPA: alpha/beta hydrolase [Polyangiaceae bacterium]|nr:alpha/beta hydrolase [Polyangiaceae bacterium]
MWRELIERQDVTAQDGAKLRAYVAGKEGPTLVLASGLGGPVSAWRYQIAHFARQYRVVSWDYRGLFGSALARPDDPVDVAIQASDLERVLDHLGTKQAIVVGWSMGVQVALEHYRRRPERTTHLVLINGTAGRPFEGVLMPGAGRLLPPLLRRAHYFHRAGGRLLRRAARTRAALDVVQRMGSLTTALPPDLLEELALEFAEIDLGVYLRTLRALGEHDAHPELGDVNVPALVIAGGRDVFTPKEQAERMARAMERSELVVVPGATHYTATEFPDVVNQRIEAFLARHRS